VLLAESASFSASRVGNFGTSVGMTVLKFFQESLTLGN